MKVLFCESFFNSIYIFYTFTVAWCKMYFYLWVRVKSLKSIGLNQCSPEFWLGTSIGYKKIECKSQHRLNINIAPILGTFQHAQRKGGCRKQTGTGAVKVASRVTQKTASFRASPNSLRMTPFKFCATHLCNIRLDDSPQILRDITHWWPIQNTKFSREDLKVILTTC